MITGRYWTFEKLTLFFCLFNLVYIPAAIWAMQTGNVAEGWTAVGRGFYRPEFHVTASHAGAAWITLIMANIGTTITPWQIFFQQVGRGRQGHGCPRHPVRQDRHVLRLAGDLHRGGVHHHRHGRPCSTINPGGADRPSIRPAETARSEWPTSRSCPIQSTGANGRGSCSPSACSTPACSAPCAFRCPRVGPWARSSAGPTR